MASVIQENLLCPYCLEELDYLNDPQLLPCSHMFCMPCLESVVVARQTGVQVKCSICRYGKFHFVSSTDSMTELW